jgi:glyoxylase-like metal-dependent hydrolase (beta-lactamase superfamily II)
VDVLQIDDGLWRWTAHHPEWNEDVGCVYVETPDGAVLIDPLVPPEDTAKFWKALDRDVKRMKGRVHVLVTVFWHARSAAEMRERYDARIWAVKSGKAAIARRTGVVTDAFAIGDELPGGIEACRTARAAEVVFWVPEHSALVPGDVLIADGKGGAKMCPESWLPAKTSHRDLAASLRPLLDLPVRRILLSHGRPVVTGGGRALARALEL